ncbi:MAG: hypothetical protein AAB502_09835 [Chloroflexota bacterium]
MTTSSYTYAPEKDELVLKIHPSRGKPRGRLGNLKIWWDEQANIGAIAVNSYSALQQEFNQNLKTVKLGGIWKDVKVTSKDIRDVRRTLLRKLEARW